MLKTTVDLITASDVDVIRAFFPDTPVEVVRAKRMHDDIKAEEQE